MSEIEVTVRVPADLEAVRDAKGTVRLLRSGEALCDESWATSVVQQIAAAIEARKPRPPKFDYGDLLEWMVNDEQRAGIVDSIKEGPQGFLYWFNGMEGAVAETHLTLVRRAAK